MKGIVWRKKIIVHEGEEIIQIPFVIYLFI